MRWKRQSGLKQLARSNGELKAKAFRYYNADDPARWGRDELPALREEVARRMGSPSNAHGIILDLGCGRGPLQLDHPQYVGVDLSFPALRRFSPGVKVVQGDIEQLPFRDQSVRLTFSIATLEHVPYPEKALEEIHRVLRPGGIAILAPAWFCRPWAAKGLPAKSYRELSWPDQLRKATISVRNNLVFRTSYVIPQRVGREIRFALKRQPSKFGYKRLHPNLMEYIYSDCDAFSSLDPHSVITFFRSHRYEILNARTFLRRVFMRSGPVVIRKPLAGGEITEQPSIAAPQTLGH